MESTHTEYNRYKAEGAVSPAIQREPSNNIKPYKRFSGKFKTKTQKENGNSKPVRKKNNWGKRTTNILGKQSKRKKLRAKDENK